MVLLKKLYVFFFPRYWGLAIRAISTLCGNMYHDQKLDCIPEVWERSSLIDRSQYTHHYDCLIVAGWSYTIYIHILCLYHGTYDNRNCTISTKRRCLDRFRSVQPNAGSDTVFHIAISAREMIVSSSPAKFENMNRHATCLDPIFCNTQILVSTVFLSTAFHDICYVLFAF